MRGLPRDMPCFSFLAEDHGLAIRRPSNRLLHLAPGHHHKFASSAAPPNQQLIHQVGPVRPENPAARAMIFLFLLTNPHRRKSHLACVSATNFRGPSHWPSHHTRRSNRMRRNDGSAHPAVSRRQSRSRLVGLTHPISNSRHSVSVRARRGPRHVQLHETATHRFNSMKISKARFFPVSLKARERGVRQRPQKHFRQVYPLPRENGTVRLTGIAAQAKSVPVWSPAANTPLGIARQASELLRIFTALNNLLQLFFSSSVRPILKRSFFC